MRPDAAVAVARRFADADEVLGLVGAPSYVAGVPPPWQQGANFRDQGEVLADWAWAELARHGRNELSDLPEAMEQVFGVDTAVMPASPGCSGLSWQTESFRLAISGPEAIPWRQRFTLAHELCHLLVGDSVDLHLEYQPGGPHGPDNDPAEIRANAFAAALLAPADLIGKVIAPAAAVSDGEFPALATRLGISPGPLVHRLERVGLVAEGLDLGRTPSTPRPPGSGPASAQRRGRQRRGRQRRDSGAGGTRTHTGTDLNRVPLPIGLRPRPAADHRTVRALQPPARPAASAETPGRGGGEHSRQVGLGQPASPSSVSTLATWPVALTLRQACSTLPSAPTTKVDRMTPCTVLPYIFFSPKAP